MRIHTSVLTFVGLTVVAFATLSAADKSSPRPAISPASIKLLAEGDAAAEKKDYPAALLKYKQAYQEIVPKLRGLAFKQEVSPKLFTRGDLQEHMKKLFADEISDEEAYLMDRSLKAFGLAKPNLDVKQMMMNLYSEQVAGFYNSENKNLVLVYDSKEDKTKEKKSLFDFLFAEEEPEFDADSQKITLAHELTHALQDQHFDLEYLHKATEHDDDMAMALSALIEGDATILMFQELDRMEGGDSALADISPRRMDMIFNLMRAFLPFSGDSLSEAPAVLRESLIFPYHKGAVLTLHLTRRGGWKAVDRAFQEPPLSTEQILHPERYLDEKNWDAPVAIEFTSVARAAGPEWKHLGGNVLGEFQIGVLLAGVANSRRAAAGWDGDRYEIFEKATRESGADAEGAESKRKKKREKSPQLGLLWLSTWDSEKDAEEFAAAYSVYQGKRLAAGKTDRDKKPAKEHPPRRDAAQPFRRQFESDAGSVYLVERRGLDVAVVEGFSPKAAESLRKAAFDRAISPKAYPSSEPVHAP